MSQPYDPTVHATTCVLAARPLCPHCGGSTMWIVNTSATRVSSTTVMQCENCKHRTRFESQIVRCTPAD